MDIQSDFLAAVADALQIQVGKALSVAAVIIHTRVRELVVGYLPNTPECRSLIGGDLQVLFGIANPAPIVSNIVRAVADSIVVQVLPPTPQSMGYIQVQAIRSDYSDVLAVPGASYESISQRRGTSTLVPWLNWLLLAGDTLVVADWGVIRGQGFRSSRTGRAIMIPRSRGFHVPSNFAGTADNNFLIRAFDDMADDIMNIMFNVLQSL